jgi:uncharacterized protein YcfL
MKIFKSVLTIFSLVFLIGCAGTESPKISKVYEVDYPDGISVIFHNQDLQDDLEIVTTRLVNGKYKKQLQLVINNSSKNTYNIVLGHEWSDSRGMILNHKMLKNKLSLNPKSSKRIILNAPNFKAKSVLLNVSCNDIQCKIKND